MASNAFLLPALVLAVTSAADAQQGKFAVINIQAAIVSTKEGQKAAADLNAKTAPKKKELEQKQTEISNLQDQLNKGLNTLSDSAKSDLYKSIESKKKSLQRQVEDAQADLEADQNKLLQQIGQKMIAIIEKYARDNGYTMVLEVSPQQNSVLYASPSVDITRDIIELYDKNTAAGAPPSSAVPAPKTPPTPTTTTKPPAPAKP